MVCLLQCNELLVILHAITTYIVALWITTKPVTQSREAHEAGTQVRMPVRKHCSAKHAVISFGRQQCSAYIADLHNTIMTTSRQRRRAPAAVMRSHLRVSSPHCFSSPLFQAKGAVAMLAIAWQM